MEQRRTARGDSTIHAPFYLIGGAGYPATHGDVG
nr:MAG TPA: hypothetical protein [Caudoviricetes sp.]